MITPPKISDYEDYRAFLKDFIDYKRKAHRGFSLEWLTRKAGLPSKSYISKVLNCKIGMGIGHATRIINALELEEIDKLNFITLIIKSEDFISQEEGAFDFQIDLCQTCIQLLSERSDFIAETTWIFHVLGNSFTEDVIEQSLNELIASGHLKFEYGKWSTKPLKHRLLPKGFDYQLFLAGLDLKHVKGAFVVVGLPQDEIKKLSEEIISLIQQKISEYDQKKDSNSSNEVGLISFHTRQFTDFENKKDN